MEFILAAIVIAVFAATSFGVTPSVHYDVLSVLGARRKGVLREGPHWFPPFVSSRERVSTELVTKGVVFEFTTKDNVKVKVGGVLQYRPDPDVVFPVSHPDDGRNVYVTVSDDGIVAGVEEAVKARIGSLGGNREYDDFVKNRPAIGDIINAILRLEKPPHILHKEWCKLGAACPYQRPIDIDQLIEFYKDHWPEIRELKAKESSHRDKRSEIELRYGIDVESFDLGDVGFTKEMQAALEEEKQADARAKAADARLEIVDKYIRMGLSPKDAADQADKLMDPEVTKTIISIQGEGGTLGAALAGIAAGALRKRSE